VEASELPAASPPTMENDSTATVDIGAYELQASIVPSADFDGSGFVTGLDFLAWQLGFGTTTSAAKTDGDADNDGDVDRDDLAVWELQYGTAAPLAAVASASIAAEPVAEPSLLATIEAVAQPSLTSSELADVALAVSLSEEADGVSGKREFVAHSPPLDFFSTEPIGRSDMQPASSFSSPANTSSTSTQESESPESPGSWEDAVDEVFASVFA
jgi:hypothetical protein